VARSRRLRSRGRRLARFSTGIDSHVHDHQINTHNIHDPILAAAATLPPVPPPHHPPHNPIKPIRQERDPPHNPVNADLDDPVPGAVPAAAQIHPTVLAILAGPHAAGHASAALQGAV
jgi:hypothetical protein